MQGIITLDFETYYDQEYSLSKLTTEEYLRDSRYETIGVSLALGDNKPVWLTGTHQEINDELVKLPWDDLGVVAHNALFDCAILNWKFGIKPKRIFDTLSMARAILPHGSSLSLANLAKRYELGEKGTEVVNAKGKRRADFTPAEFKRYAAYCRLDVTLTQKLFKALLADGIPMDELKLIDLTIRMFTEPVLRLDSSKLHEHLSKVRKDKKDLLIDVAKELGKEYLSVHLALGEQEAMAELKKDLGSNIKFAALLEKHGVEVPMKISPTTGKETYAFAKTDEDFQALSEHEDSVVQALHAARIGVKSTIEETRTERFIEIAKRGSFPVPLKYFGAHTSRWCLTGDTIITVLRAEVVLHIALSQLEPRDLVWDGEEFVEHGGLVYKGRQEVMHYDGVTGTLTHPVFCEGEHHVTSLHDAWYQGKLLQSNPVPPMGPHTDGVLNERYGDTD